MLVNATNGGIRAQSLRYPVAMPFLELSAYSMKQTDAISFTANQAALARAVQPGIGIYGEKRFGMAALNASSVAVAMPTNMGNFGLQLNYAGFKNFNENKIGLAYARNLGPKLDIGVQFNYYGYHIPSYSNASTVNFEAGAILHFTSRFNGGIHIYNPVGGKLGKEREEKIAAVYKMALGYDASENFFVSCEMIKEENKPVNLVAGIQYQFAGQFILRTGFTTASSTFFAGAGVGWKNMRLYVSGSYHQQLGISPAVLLLANFGSRKNKQE
ncbi:PorV/PorQ family protein [Ferruginibacter sp.]